MILCTASMVGAASLNIYVRIILNGLSWLGLFFIPVTIIAAYTIIVCAGLMEPPFTCDEVTG